MPKSKRDKKISLTKTDKKGLALKQQLVEDIKRCVETFNSIYVFTVHNMRNELMKDLRIEWRPSRFFFGKNKVIALGFGRTPEEEIGDDLHKLSATLKGPCVILFTDKPKDYVTKWFSNYTIEDYARSGFKATSTITVEEGPLTQFAHSMEPYLRQLGLPTSLERGVVTMLKDHEICKAGSILTPEQAKILKLLEYKLTPCQLVLKACWIKDNGFEMLTETTEEENEMQCEEDDD